MRNLLNQIAYAFDNPEKAWPVIFCLCLAALFFMGVIIQKIRQTGGFTTYNVICILMIGGGAAVLSIFPPIENPVKALAAICFIAVGLFLLIFQGKSASQVKEAMDDFSTISSIPRPPDGS